MSEILIVCVPGAKLDDQTALLRLVLVPRLTGPATTLAGYGLQNWPGLIRGATVEVRLRPDPNTPAIALPATVVTDAQDAVWAAFFAPTTVVLPYAGQAAYADPATDGATGHAERISAAYQTAAVGVGAASVVRQQYQGLDLPAPTSKVTADPRMRPPSPPPDFHRTVAMLREHPRVLRALGLIVDVFIPRAALAQIGATGQISAGWTAAPPGVGTVTSPWTVYDLRSGHFLPASTRTVRDGLVDLRTEPEYEILTQAGGLLPPPPDWVITTMDVDSAVARLSDAKAAIESAAHPTEVSLPALRTSGITLLHRNQGAMLAVRAGRGRASRTRGIGEEPPPLTADNLVLGYRVDVKPRGQDWVSLTRRKATYVINGVTIGAAAQIEEGHSKPATAVNSGLEDDDSLIASEAVVRWDGWSLALPREPIRPPADAPATTNNLPYDFSWIYEADLHGPPLPTLRFGSGYQLRARVIDLAGGGLELGDPVGDGTATDLISYGRLEPVPPPRVADPKGLLTPNPSPPPGNEPIIDYTLLGPGGALDVLVVRSDPKGTPSQPGGAYPPNDTRFLLPPSMDLNVADQMGSIDGADEATFAHVVRAMNPPHSFFDPAGSPVYTWLPDRAASGVAVAPRWDSGEAAAVAAQRDWDTANWPDLAPKTLRLVGTLGDFVLVDWHGATEVRVAVPPGKQVVTEVSSTLPDGALDLFAAGVWATGQQDATVAAYSGRHPMVTPPTRLRLVHAVRRPLLVPHAEFSTTRGRADTSASVFDNGQPILGVDRDSTLQVEVVAQWKEWADAADPTPLSRVVATLPVERTSTTLPPIRQDFGDTKHREVTYGLTARSRYRQYFAANEPEDAFAATGSGGVVHIPSSARPPAPTVLSAVPAFLWETTQNGAATIRVRHGGRIRLELASPWYATGQGETLAVIVAGDAGPSPDAWSQLSTISRDPILDTPSPSSLTAGSCVGAAGPASQAVDQESGATVTAVPYAVFFADGRRFADVDLGVAADVSYAPLVSLSVARRQSFSLPGLGLSPLVRVDHIPLLPTRILTVTRGDDGVTVRLEGVAPRTPTHIVKVRMQSLPPGASPESVDISLVSDDLAGIGWQQISTTETVLGRSTAPIPIPADGGIHRVVVSESAAVPEPDDASSGLAGDDPLAVALAQRTVFVDVVMV